MKNDKKETAEEFAERMKIKWHNATIQIKPDNAPVSTSLPNKLMKDLHEALAFIDRLSAENKDLRAGCEIVECQWRKCLRNAVSYHNRIVRANKKIDNLERQVVDLRASREKWKNAAKWAYGELMLHDMSNWAWPKEILGDEFKEIKE